MAVIPRRGGPAQRPPAQPQPSWAREQRGGRCERPETPCWVLVRLDLVQLAALLWTAVTIHVDLPLNAVICLRNVAHVISGT